MVNFTGGADQRFKPIFFGNASANAEFLKLPAAKPFIYELHGVWSYTQKLLGASGNQLGLEDILTISQRYREAINGASSLLGPSNNEISNAHILWGLTEAIYFYPSKASIVLNLIEWGNACFKDSSKLINERLNDEVDLENHEFYWNSVILSIMQVNLNAAIRLLRKHSRYQHDMALQQICSYIEGFQVVLDQGLQNPKTFLDIQRKLRESVVNGSFKRSDQLTIISGLLLGKKEVYEKTARSMYDSWFECLPAYTLFTAPGATIESIGGVAQDLYNILCPKGVHISVVESLVSDIDRPIFSILSRNLVDLLKQICEHSNFWWFPVHFIELLYHYDSDLIASLTEVFPTLQVSTQSSEQRNIFSVHTAMLNDYGKALLNSDDYWIIGSDYLNAANSSNSAQSTEEPYLNVELDSVNKAEYIYAQAVKNDHLLTKEKVSKWFVKKMESMGHLSEALCWALRSNTPDLINSVSNKLLMIPNAESVITQMKIFDAMAEQFYQYPSLLLLQRFYEFRRCLLQGQASEAATRIHELVTSGIAPIGFQVVLFDQMAKLLDASSDDFIQTPQLDRDSIYDLMKAVNKFQIQNSIINPPQIQKENATTLELNAKIKFLRQALCNALANRSLT